MNAPCRETVAWLPVEDAELLAIVVGEEDFEEAAEALGRPAHVCAERYERLTGHSEPAAALAARAAAERAMLAKVRADGGFARQVRIDGRLHFVAPGCDGRLVAWRAP